MITPQTQARLLLLARQAITEYLASGAKKSVKPSDWPEEALAPRACFITLTKQDKQTKHDDLRGCVGTLDNSHPLVTTVRDFAINAAVNDRRFPPVTAQELDRLEISISILGDSKAVAFANCAALAKQLRPGVDGLILSAGSRRGLFLPQVWETLTDGNEFIHQLKLKAGIQPNCEPPQLRAEVFQVEHF